MDLNYLNQYPNFKEIVSKVVETSHLQKKIINFHKKVDNSYFNKAEKFSLNFKSI